MVHDMQQIGQTSFFTPSLGSELIGRFETLRDLRCALQPLTCSSCTHTSSSHLLNCFETVGDLQKATLNRQKKQAISALFL
jgi:hypothetical protein